MFFSEGSTPTIVGAQPCHGLGQKPAAAADIEEAQALEGLAVEGVAAKAGADLLLDIVQAHRVEDMENPELALGIPPFGGHFREFFNFGGVEGGKARRRSFQISNFMSAIIAYAKARHL